MADEAERAKEIEAAIKKADKTKADAEDEERSKGETLNKLLEVCDSLVRRMDTWEAKEKADAEARKDDEAASREKSDPLPLAADSEDKKVEIKDGKLCDSNGDPIPMAHNAKADSVLRTNTESAYRNDAANAQARADRVTQVYSQSAPPIMAGETIRAYRVRLLNMLKPSSPTYKGVESSELAQMSPATFAIAENTIYTDADHAGRHPAVPEGRLVEYYSTDASGRRITNFAGQTKDWLRDFCGTKQRVIRINGTGRNRDND